MPASRANVKTIRAGNYTSEYFRIFDDTVLLYRDHFFEKETREIDCHGSFWTLYIGSFKPGQVSIRRHGKLISLDGPRGFFVPPFSIIDWNLGPGKIHWEAFTSLAPLPNDFPARAFSFKLPGKLPGRLLDTQEDESLLVDSKQRLLDLVRSSVQRVIIEKEEQSSSISKRVKEYLSLHFQEECPIREIAGRLRYSHAVMARYFKRDFDLSPVEYRSRLRVFEALITMQNSDASVAQSQFQVGYNDPSAFFRQFKKFTLIKPSMFSR